MTEFEQHVIEALAELRTDMRSVKEHLAKLNGKVAAHELKVGEMQLDMVKHQAGCPLREKVEPIEEWMTTRKAEISAQNRWVSRLMPVFYMIGGVSVVLILQNAGSWLAAIKH